MNLGQFGNLPPMGWHPTPPGGGPNSGISFPSEIPPASYGCGDYPEWIAYEAWHANREAEQASNERYAEHVGPDTAYLYGGEIERYWVSLEIPMLGKTSDEWQEAIDCTLFARRFLRWVENGCPIEAKGNP